MGSDSDATVKDRDKDRDRDREIAGHYRMLKETAKHPELPSNRLGEEPDADGEAGSRVVQQFNRTLNRLEALDAIPHGMFAPLPDDAGWASMSIAHEQLAAFIGSPDGRVRVEKNVEIETTTDGPGPFVLNFRPYIGAETDATEIGALARELMPDDVRAAWQTMQRVEPDGEESPEEVLSVWKTVSKVGDDDVTAARNQQVADFLLSDGVSAAKIDKKLAELRELATRRAKERRDGKGDKEKD